MSSDCQCARHDLPELVSPCLPMRRCVSGTIEEVPTQALLNSLEVKKPNTREAYWRRCCASPTVTLDQFRSIQHNSWARTKIRAYFFCLLPGLPAD